VKTPLHRLSTGVARSGSWALESIQYLVSKNCKLNTPVLIFILGTMRPLKKKPMTVMRNKIKVKTIGKKEGGGGEKQKRERRRRKAEMEGREMGLISCRCLGFVKVNTSPDDCLYYK